MGAEATEEEAGKGQQNVTTESILALRCQETGRSVTNKMKYHKILLLPLGKQRNSSPPRSCMNKKYTHTHTFCKALGNL